MLTHFSQRYPKIPVFDDALTNVAIAFDLMQIEPHHISHFHRITPALRALYEDLERRESSDGDPEKPSEPSRKRVSPPDSSSSSAPVQSKRSRKAAD